ncbi:MAG: DUF1800 family protein, partial [Acidobacteriota bacterium]|nr:DUF1800 family protein [Acidobacteriota bacterium]
MKVQSFFTRKTANRIVTLFLMSALLVSISAQSTISQSDKVARLTDDQRIVHVLNRLGYGARPGDLERVKTMGLETYINQQLSPEKLSDAVAQDKIKNLSTLSMT